MPCIAIKSLGIAAFLALSCLISDASAFAPNHAALSIQFRTSQKHFSSHPRLRLALVTRKELLSRGAIKPSLVQMTGSMRPSGSQFSFYSFECTPWISRQLAEMLGVTIRKEWISPSKSRSALIMLPKMWSLTTGPPFCHLIGYSS
jgi:hypothetical protein